MLKLHMHLQLSKISESESEYSVDSPQYPESPLAIGHGRPSRQKNVPNRLNECQTEDRQTDPQSKFHSIVRYILLYTNKVTTLY